VETTLLLSGRRIRRSRAASSDAVLGRFDQPDPESLLLRDLDESIEEDGLARSAKPDQEEALAWPACDGPPEGDAESIDEIVSPGERRRGCAGSGTVWIGQFIHRSTDLSPWNGSYS
jgi:hypothetical protein